MNRKLEATRLVGLIHVGEEKKKGDALSHMLKLIIYMVWGKKGFAIENGEVGIIEKGYQ